MATRVAAACAMVAPTWGLMAGSVHVTRHLPDSILTTTGSFHAELTVTVTGEAPNGSIVTETLPDGWTLTGATWNDADFAPRLIGRSYKWLFDDHEGHPVASGTLA